MDIILNFETVSPLEPQFQRIYVACIPSPEALYHSVAFGLAGGIYPSSHTFGPMRVYERNVEGMG